MIAQFFHNMVKLNFVLAAKNLQKLCIGVDIVSSCLAGALILNLVLLESIGLDVLPESSNDLGSALLLDP